MLKKGIKVIVFILLVIVILLYCCGLLRYKSMNGIDPMYAFYQNEENTIDALFLGSSHMFTGVNTGVLWDEFGISAYDLGGADQPFWNTYFFLEEALKTQSPKVIVVEIYSAAIQEGHYQHMWALENLYGMKFGRDFIDAVMESAPEEDWENLLNPFANYHSRYSMLSEEDFRYKERMSHYKGFISRYGTNPLETPDISMVTELQPPNEKMADYMIKIIDLAKEEGIPLVLVCAPYAINAEQQKIFNCFYQYAEENSVPYIDFNKCYNAVGIDFKQDFFDWSHLNEKGNEKYTKYLGYYLDSTYQLPDHRGDSKYLTWEEDARYQEHEKMAYELTTMTDLNQYLSKLKEQDYVVMMAIRNLTDTTKISSEVKANLLNFGLDEKSLTKEENVIIDGNRIIESSPKKNFQIYFEDEAHDFGIKRTYIVPDKDVYDDTPEDITRIYVDGQDYFMADCNINIVVYDRVLERVADDVGVQLGDTIQMIRDVKE